MSDELNGGGVTEPAGDQTPIKNDEPNVQAQLATTQAQKEHWREKAIDPKTGKPYKELYEELSNQPKPEPKSDVDFLETAKVAKKYDEKELEIIVNYSKRTGLGIPQAEKDDMVQLAIEAHRAKVAKENAIPIPSGASTSSGSFKKVEEMTREEHMQYEKDVLAQKKANN